MELKSKKIVFMKKSKLSLLSIAFLSLVLVCCSESDAQHQLIGKWKSNKVECKEIDKEITKLKVTLDTVKDPNEKTNTEFAIKNYKAALDIYKNLVLDLRTDGKYDMVYAYKDLGKISGKWQLSSDVKKLIIINDKEQKDSIQIRKIEANKTLELIWKSNKATLELYMEPAK